MNAVILAGGKSSRMGFAKALLPWQQGLYIDTLLAQLDALTFAPTMLAAPKATFIGRADLQQRCIADYLACAYQGPLSGVASALHRASTDWLLVQACDSYCPDAAVWQHLQANKLAAGIVYIRDATGCDQPLLSLWHKAVLPDLEQYLQQGHRRLMGFIASQAHKRLPISSEVYNANTPEAFAKLCKASKSLS